MAKVHGLDADVFFGGVDEPLPDWRKVLANELADDDEEPSRIDSEIVKSMLGFDPDELDDDDDDEEGDTP